MLRLNVGCGTNIKPGYINIDSVERELYPPDILMDLNNESLLDLFEPSSVDGILAQDIIEHFNKFNVIKLMNDFYMLLQSGAGSVVTKNIPRGEVWVGIPTKKLERK